MNLIRFLLRQNWKMLVFSTVCAVVSGMAGAALAALIGNEINGIAVSSRPAWLFVGLCAASLLTRAGSALSLMHLVQSVILKLRVDVSRRLLRTEYVKLEQLGKPALLAMLTNDVNAMINAFQVLPLTFGNAILLVVCLAYMAWLSPSVFAVVICLLVCGVGVYRYLERHPLRAMAELREHMDVLYKNFRSLIEGSRELNLNAQRGTLFVERVIAPGAVDNKRLFISTMRGYVAADGVGTLMFYVGFGTLLFAVPGALNSDPAVRSQFIVVLLFLIGPISQLMAALPVLRTAELSLARLEQLDGELAAGNMPASPVDPFANGGELHLELRNVCHQYAQAGGGSRFRLGPVNLSFRKGEIVFLAGGNGSGKTTLAMLLLGFYMPDTGQIRLNGTSVDTSNCARYRSYFSAIFSDFHLFEQLLATEGGDANARAAHYLEKLGMAGKVRVEDGKFSTIELSSGQRKRLALVSSYIEDRPIYLFDEWAADQDPVFKRIFYTELLPELKARGKIVIAITHDDSYFSYADRVIKIEDGRLQLMESRSEHPVT